MNVAFLAHYSELYGANRSLLDLIQGLRLHGVNPHVVVPADGPLADTLQESGIPVSRFPIQWWYGQSGQSTLNVTAHFGRKLSAGLRLAKNTLLIRPLARQLMEWDIDLVYTNSVVIPIGAIVSKRISKPHIWHFREYAELDYNLKKDWGNFVFNRVVQSSAAHIAVSGALGQYYAQAVAPKKCNVIYNGVAFRAKFEELREQAEMRGHASSFRFAMVGLISQSKGQETAIRAFAKLAATNNSVRLVIAGSGDDAPLRRLVAELELDESVEFLGFVDDPFSVYVDCDAVLMCSKMEAMGRVTAEAMAAARPVIGNDSGGTPELIEHGRTGLLFDGTTNDLARCMARLVDDPKWARQLGQTGWMKARKQFSIETYAARVYEVIASCL